MVEQLHIQVAAASLTSRELEVLRLLADGHGTESICNLMYISESTAKSHRYRLFDKLHAVNAAHAVALAYRLGLLTGAGPVARVVHVRPGDVLLISAADDHTTTDQGAAT